MVRKRSEFWRNQSESSCRDLANAVASSYFLQYSLSVFSSPFPIQHLNWVRTNVAHLRLGINKQSVWREQESRIHFATQKKFNVNKQCITAHSTLHSPSLAHHNLFNSAGLLVDIVDKAEHNDGCCPNTTARECTCHLSADRRRSHGVSFKPRNNASSTHFIPLKVISNNK